MQLPPFFSSSRIKMLREDSINVFLILSCCGFRLYRDQRGFKVGDRHNRGMILTSKDFTNELWILDQD